jgi:hypothetical protein
MMSPLPTATAAGSGIGFVAALMAAMKIAKIASAMIHRRVDILGGRITGLSSSVADYFDRFATRCLHRPT